MLDKQNQRYFDYLVRLQVHRFTGKVEFNFHLGTIRSADQETRPMPGVKEKERVKV